MSETMIPVAVCPHCGYRMDRTTEAYGDAAPKPGDVSLCMKCGEATIFDHDLTLRSPTEQERLEINRDPHVRRAQRLLRSGESQAYWRSKGGADA